MVLMGAFSRLSGLCVLTEDDTQTSNHASLQQCIGHVFHALHMISFHPSALLTNEFETVSAGMDARLTWSMQVGFIRLFCFESLVKHVGHGDAWDANHLLEHIYFIRVVLLLSLLQSLDKWKDVSRVVNPKPVINVMQPHL